MTSTQVVQVFAFHKQLLYVTKLLKLCQQLFNYIFQIKSQALNANNLMQYFFLLFCTISYLFFIKNGHTFPFPINL
nr:MAG TPA: hypothetical protein [Caudoviricetes sp.]